MYIGVADIFKVGIGPSSSHTVGPMKAAKRFRDTLAQSDLLSKVNHLRVELFGSLGATGKGHGTDVAILLGLLGETPEHVDIDLIPSKIANVREQGWFLLLEKKILLSQNHLIFHKKESLPLHTNGMKFIAFDEFQNPVVEKIFYSIGGGFVVDHQGEALFGSTRECVNVPYPFQSASELLSICKETGLSVSSVMIANELSFQTFEDLKKYVDCIWNTMKDCVQRGCNKEGILPGGLKVKRRAPALFRRLKIDARVADPLVALDWVNLWALAVNEENAAGGRVVTAPTNGAAGIVPAVLLYYHKYTPGADEEGTLRFLLTATAIASLYKKNASISGAEVGCQGEVGVACSMAAGALTDVLGGTAEQVENAAEIGMEHNLGLTCDPIGGLVQVPCIERNAMGATKAINASRIALSGDGTHKVSLDKVIATMRATGADMSTKYKETARGGLALNVIEC